MVLDTGAATGHMAACRPQTRVPQTRLLDGRQPRLYFYFIFQ